MFVHDENHGILRSSGVYVQYIYQILDTTVPTISYIAKIDSSRFVDNIRTSFHYLVYVLYIHFVHPANHQKSYDHHLFYDDDQDHHQEMEMDSNNYNYYHDENDEDDDDDNDLYEQVEMQNYWFSGDVNVVCEIPKDDPIPTIVKAARDGDLKSIKKFISYQVDLDKRQRWTQIIQNKDSETWEWFNNSALIEASLRGHIDIVRQLLLSGADPMLESCFDDDQFHTAIKAAMYSKFKNDKNKQIFTKIIKMLTVTNKLWTELNPKCNESAHFEKNRKEKNKPSLKDIKIVIDKLENDYNVSTNDKNNDFIMI